ncbi:hypothetical protein R3P38DRAFT_2757924 [Favolaschia claudopus]|uniref:Cyclin N-terminal domain-containing protein n=1 Tax=Favolaschia claudopus TaxID=2862362 RepID=A0AAW0E8I9_9AGAR
MPVPVPRVSKQAAHPVYKNSQTGPNPLKSLTCSLPVSPPGPPPSFGTREEWINSLPTWRRTKPRRIWEDDSRAQGLPAEQQDFYSGLAPAPTNASAIKGSRAEACIPPLYTLFRPDGAPLTSDPDAADADDEMSSDYSALDRLAYGDNESQWSDGSMGMDVDYQSQLAISTSSSPSGLPIYDHSRDYERGAFTPVFEDQSPGVYSGPDVGSSPVGPVTPFGEFVDRAVAAETAYVTYEEGSSAKSQAQHEHYISAQSHDASELRSYVHSDRPKQDITAPAPEVVTPTATSGYRKLAEPLSEWVANYVWKACSTGFSLPSEFAHPCGNVVKPLSSYPPPYLANAVHSLLLSTLLQPSAVFLAVWYMARLPVYYDAVLLGPDYVKESRFRMVLFGSNLDPEVTQATAPFRLIVLGCMLANKWLDDHTFSNKTWHAISNVPVQILNELESLALDIFGYDLSIPSSDWSEWLAQLVAYHEMSSSPSRPQPISRPSTNPHAIVRKALDEIIQAPAACNYDPASPQPVFLGLEERRRERMEKEQARSVDVLEIDLDEDGPLREEYLPKRRVSAAGSAHSSFRSHDVLSLRTAGVDAADTQNRLGSGTHHTMADKLLPPPARWSPAGDEPILRERNRASGHYVAVQPPLLPSVIQYQIAPTYHPQPELGFTNQNWPPAPPAFVAVKPPALMGVGYMFDGPPLHVAHAPYPAPAYPFVPSASHLALSHQHSRSQSLSYDQDNSHSRNRLRSCSQSQAQALFEYRQDNSRGDRGVAPIEANDPRWGPAPASGHFAYPAPPPFANPHSHAHMQPAWLRT